MTAPVLELLEMEPATADAPAPLTSGDVSAVVARVASRNLSQQGSWRRVRRSGIEFTVSPSDAPSEPQPARRPARRMKVKRERALAKHRLAGETFLVEVNRRRVFIKHPIWSLMGSGKTFLEAERNLRNEAEELAEILRETPAEALDHEALRLFHFVLRIA